MGDSTLTSQVMVDPSRPVAACRITVDPTKTQPLDIQCRHDRERLPAAREQKLQCQMKPKFSLEKGKAVFDFEWYCGKSFEQEARRAKALFHENPRVFRRLKESEMKDLNLKGLKLKLEKKEYLLKKAGPQGEILKELRLLKEHSLKNPKGAEEIRKLIETHKSNPLQEWENLLKNDYLMQKRLEIL